MYGDSPYNMDKEILYGEINDFLEEHPISELLEVVSDSIKHKEWIDEGVLR
jgi:hypothetical protein